MAAPTYLRREVLTCQPGAVHTWHFGDIRAARLDVRFRALFGHQRVARLCRRMTDGVEKLSDEQRAGNNRIQVPRSLNQCCVPDSYLESMLLTRASKNVFRQHRPLADISRARAAEARRWAFSCII